MVKNVFKELRKLSENFYNLDLSGGKLSRDISLKGIINHSNEIRKTCFKTGEVYLEAYKAAGKVDSANKTWNERAGSEVISFGLGIVGCVGSLTMGMSAAGAASILGGAAATGAVLSKVYQGMKGYSRVSDFKKDSDSLAKTCKTLFPKDSLKDEYSFKQRLESDHVRKYLKFLTTLENFDSKKLEKYFTKDQIGDIEYLREMSCIEYNKTNQKYIELQILKNERIKAFEENFPRR